PAVVAPLRVMARLPPDPKLRSPVLNVAAPAPPGAKVPLTTTGPVTDPVVLAKVAPAATVVALVAVRPPKLRVPPDTVVAPVYVCAAARVRVPAPPLTSPCDPLTTPS